MKTNRSHRGKTSDLEVVDLDLVAQASCRFGWDPNPQVLGPISFLAPHYCHHPAPSPPNGDGKSFVDTCSWVPPVALTDCRSAVEEPSLPRLRSERPAPARRIVESGGSGARQREKGSPRARGLAFVALKTFQRACHGDAQRLRRGSSGPRLPRGTFQRFGGCHSRFPTHLPLGSGGQSALPLREDLPRPRRRRLPCPLGARSVRAPAARLPCISLCNLARPRPAP